MNVNCHMRRSKRDQRTSYTSRAPDAAQREAGEAYVREFGRWTAAQREAFGSHPHNRVVEFPSSNHYFFLEKPWEARRIIRDFVSSLP